MELLDRLFEKMVDYYRGDPRRIQHFVKVHGFAALIGREEGLSQEEQFLLEAAAYVHDIGIRPAEEKYGACGGKLQEQEGPPAAEKMLKELGGAPTDRQRICWLVGHHHTDRDIQGMDYQILVEADFLVNLYEDQAGPQAVRAAGERIFRTAAGRRILERMFAAEP